MKIFKLIPYFIFLSIQAQSQKTYFDTAYFASPTLAQASACAIRFNKNPNSNYMKLLFTTLSFLFTITCFAQTKSIRFAIYFGNDLYNDSATLILNSVTVAKNIKLEPAMMSPKSLIITQNSRTLLIEPYHGKSYTLPKLKIVKNILSVKISVNNVWKEFQFNLLKGKFLFVELPSNNGKKDYNHLKIRQSIRGPIYI